MYFRKSATPSREEVKTNRDITLAGVRVGDNLQIAGTKCNPKEQFEKKRARMIAEGRAEKKPIMIIPIDNLKDKEVIGLFVNQCKEIINNKVLFNGIVAN